MCKLLTLDLSTTATGYAKFDLKTKKLLEYGLVKPVLKGIRGAIYPKGALKKIQDLAIQIKHLIDSDPEISQIWIEEINRGISRMSQKTLDGLHYILLDRIEHKIEIIRFKDSDGRTGWRTALGLVLSENDKLLNKQNRDFNKRRPKGIPLKPIITKKHLACRWVNAKYGTKFDCDERETDADMADAIGLGAAILGN